MFYLRPEKSHVEPEIQQAEAAVPDWPARFETLAGQARDPRLKAFYQAGVVAADTPLETVPLVAMDFETTGLDLRRSGIVSIGLVAMTLKRIRLRDARHWILKPRVQLTSESVVVHHITHSEVDCAPDLAQVMEELLLALQGHVVVVHHRGIERPFLDAALRQRIGEGIEFPVIDTMELEARLYRAKPPGVIDRLLRRKPPSIRLADSRARYHLPYYAPHHALTDALATAELLQAQVAHRFSPRTPVGELWK